MENREDPNPKIIYDAQVRNPAWVRGGTEDYHMRQKVEAEVQDRLRDDRLTDAADKFNADMKAAWLTARQAWQHDELQPGAFTAFQAGYIAGYERHIDRTMRTVQSMKAAHEVNK